MFYKKAVLKIFAIFTGKQTPVLESLFNKVAAGKVRLAALLKTSSNTKKSANSCFYI